MDNSYSFAQQRLNLIATNADRIAKSSADSNIQGHAAEILEQVKELTAYLKEKQSLLENKAPTGIYKSGPKCTGR